MNISFEERFWDMILWKYFEEYALRFEMGGIDYLKNFRKISLEIWNLRFDYS